MVGNGLPGLPSVPFDYASTVKDDNWQERLHWPMTHRRQFEIGHTIHRALLDHCIEIPVGSLRDVFLLASGRIGGQAIAYAEAAVLLDAAEAEKIDFAGTSRIYRVLTSDAQASTYDIATFKPLAKSHLPWARRILRVQSWSKGPMRTVGTLLHPDGTAITHNALLRDYAARSGRRISFVNAESLYNKITKKSQPLPSGRHAELDEIATLIAENLVVLCKLTNESIARRLKACVRAIAKTHLVRAASDLAAASNVRLPEKLLAGTGGYWPTRTISIAQLRRGGEVDRFEHGILAGLIDVLEPIVNAELSVSTRFWVPSVHLSSALHETGAAAMAAPIRQVEVRAWDAGLRILPSFKERRRSASGRPRVLYGPSILRGDRQLVPALLPDPVHWDHQLRLVEILKDLPLDLILRPHPEGLFRGQRHPLSQVHPTEDRSYETLIDHADVLLFDYGQSTTMFEALITDRPIVFLNFWQSTLHSRHVADGEGPMPRNRCNFR